MVFGHIHVNDVIAYILQNSVEAWSCVDAGRVPVQGVTRSDAWLLLQSTTQYARKTWTWKTPLSS